MLVFALPLFLMCVLLARRRGGGLSNLAGSDVAWLALPIGSFLLEAAFQAASRFILIPSPVRAAQILLQYAGLFAFALRNARWDAGALVAGVGAAMNFLVIALTVFKCPFHRQRLWPPGNIRVHDAECGHPPAATWRHHPAGGRICEPGRPRADRGGRAHLLRHDAAKQTEGGERA